MKNITLSYLEEHLNQKVSIKIKHSDSIVGLQAVINYKIIKGTLLEVINDRVKLNVKGIEITIPFAEIITIEE